MNTTDWIQTELLIYAVVVALVAVGVVYLIQSWRQKRQVALAKQQGTRRVSFETASTSRVRFYIVLFVIVFVGVYLYFYFNQNGETTATPISPESIDTVLPDEIIGESFIAEGASMEGTSVIENITPHFESGILEAPELEMELPHTTTPILNESVGGGESIEKMSPVSGNSRKHTPKFRRGLVPF